MFLPSNAVAVQERPDTYYGIDLGTTYSLIAQISSNEAERNTGGSPEMPVKFLKFRQESPLPTEPPVNDEKVASIVAYYDSRAWVGRGLENLKGHPEFVKNQNIFYHCKLDMGIEQYPLYPDAAMEKLDNPAKIASAILRYMKSKGAKEKGELRNTVVTVPASFQMNQRKDVVMAAELAGIKLSNQMLIDEPNAAFIGYFDRLEVQTQHEFFSKGTSRKVLVFDIGGGTCDLSILDVSYNTKKGMLMGNKAISRYNDLGGQDLDMMIAEEFLFPLWKETFGVEDDFPLRDLQQHILPQLAIIGEQLKHGICDLIGARYRDTKLSDEQIDNTDFRLQARRIIYKAKTYDFPEIRFNARALADFLEKLFNKGSYKFTYFAKHIASVEDTIDNVLEKANLSKLDIDAVLMIGGSSKNPLLTSRLKDVFPESEFWCPQSPDKLVARGAAVYSYYYHRYGKSLIRPVVSDTLGVETKDNQFHSLIPRGSQLPVTINAGNFKLQRAFQQELIVPICLNTTSYVIQDIKIPLDGKYSGDDEVEIEATINENKVMSLELHIGREKLLSYTLENPFFFGSLSKQQVDFVKVARELQVARSMNDNNTMRQLYKKLMSLHFDVKNHHEVVLLAEEYESRYGHNDTDVLNYLYIGNDNIGRKKKAMEYLEKAIRLRPNSPALRYNYSLQVEKDDGTEAALQYLENCPDVVKQDYTVKCRIILLKNRLGEDVADEVNEITQQFETEPHNFDSFDKDNLLPQIFKLAGKPYTHYKEIEVAKRNRNVLMPSTKPIKR